MLPLLAVLNDLSWAIEWAAMDHMGEGKSELGILCKKLRSEPANAVEGTDQIADELEAARAAHVADDKRWRA